MTTSGFNQHVTGNTVGFGAANGTGITAISGSTNLFVGLDFTTVTRRRQPAFRGMRFGD